jgi:hypothetical protein
VPAQQRIRRHQPAHPQRSREQPRQGGERRPVGPVQLGPGVLPAQHGYLLAEHQQFGVLRRRRTCQQRHPPGQADEHQIQHPYHHKPAILPVQRPSRLAYSQVSYLCPVMKPHRRSSWGHRSTRARPRKTIIPARQHERVISTPGTRKSGWRIPLITAKVELRAEFLDRRLEAGVHRTVVIRWRAPRRPWPQVIRAALHGVIHPEG